MPGFENCHSSVGFELRSRRACVAVFEDDHEILLQIFLFFLFCAFWVINIDLRSSNFSWMDATSESSLSSSSSSSDWFSNPRVLLIRVMGSFALVPFLIPSANVAMHLPVLNCRHMSQEELGLFRVFVTPPFSKDRRENSRARALVVSLYTLSLSVRKTHSRWCFTQFVQRNALDRVTLLGVPFGGGPIFTWTASAENVLVEIDIGNHEL